MNPVTVVIMLVRTSAVNDVRYCSWARSREPSTTAYARTAVGGSARGSAPRSARGSATLHHQASPAGDQHGPPRQGGGEQPAGLHRHAPHGCRSGDPADEQIGGRLHEGRGGGAARGRGPPSGGPRGGGGH